MPNCILETTRANRLGSQTSSRVVGIASSKACSIERSSINDVLINGMLRLLSILSFSSRSSNVSFKERQRMIIASNDYPVTHVSPHLLVSLSRPSCQKMDGPSRIEMLLRGVKQTLKRERRGDGNIEPFKIASFRERKVADDVLTFLNRGTFEDDDHPRFVGTSIILTNDTGFPKFPDVTDFLWQQRGDSVHSHTWLETVIGNDFHRVSSSIAISFTIILEQNTALARRVYTGTILGILNKHAQKWKILAVLIEGSSLV